MDGFLEKLKKHLLNAVVIAAAVFVSFKIYAYQGQERAKLIQQKEQEMQKNQVILHISRLEKKFALYKKLFTSSPTTVIDTLGEYAKMSGVRIVSLRPGPEIGGEIFTKFPFDVTIAADGYHSVARFISSLENSSDVYIVENLSLKPQGAQSPGQTKIRVDGSLRISALVLRQ